MQHIRLVIADGRTLFRQGLVALLSAESGFIIVAEASDEDALRHACSRLLPDVVVLDAGLPCGRGRDALTITTGLRAISPGTAIIILSEAGSSMAQGQPMSEKAAQGAADAECKRALGLGASACLRPTVDAGELIRSIRSAVRSSEGHHFVQTHVVHDSHVPTEREAEILALIAQGLCNKEIAQRLNIHTQTVKNHVSHLLEKLDLADRLQLAVYALEHATKD